MSEHVIQQADNIEKRTLSNKLLTNVSKFRELGLIVFIVLLCAFIQWRNSSFLTFENISDMVTNAAILSILAVGMMLVLVTRGIDLSIGAIIALSGMVCAQLVSQYSLNPFLIILIGIAIGIVCGVLNGFLIAKIGILPIIATGKILGINNLIVIAIVIYIIFYYVINLTVIGRQIYAVGSNPESAKVSGINENKILILVYSTLGGLSGLSGVLWVSKFASAQGDTATGYELTVIAACILGGVSIAGGAGKVSGVLLGALLLGILQNALPLLNVSPFWQTGIQGAIILIAVILNTLVKRSVDRNNLVRRKI